MNLKDFDPGSSIEQFAVPVTSGLLQVRVNIICFDRAEIGATIGF